MSTITAILEADTDGTLHLPVPAELRRGKLKVEATVERVGEHASALPLATPEMLRKRKEAFEKLREVNPFRDIKDPVAWQREIRKDRPLQGRD